MSCEVCQWMVHMDYGARVCSLLGEVEQCWIAEEVAESIVVYLLARERICYLAALLNVRDCMAIDLWGLCGAERTAVLESHEEYNGSLQQKKAYRIDGRSEVVHQPMVNSYGAVPDLWEVEVEELAFLCCCKEAFEGAYGGSVGWGKDL
jgi:hypothetical protein